jgi:hypothetical protein
LPGRPPLHSTVPAPTRHSTVVPLKPVPRRNPPRPKSHPAVPKPGLRAPKVAAPKRQVARILDDDSTLLDLIDNLLSKGVMLNADLILALANVDLVYIRLSALLCAADRVLPHARRRPERPATA